MKKKRLHTETGAAVWRKLTAEFPSESKAGTVLAGGWTNLAPRMIDGFEPTINALNNASQGLDGEAFLINPTAPLTTAKPVCIRLAYDRPSDIMRAAQCASALHGIGELNHSYLKTLYPMGVKIQQTQVDRLMSDEACKGKVKLFANFAAILNVQFVVFHMLSDHGRMGFEDSARGREYIFASEQNRTAAISATSQATFDAFKASGYAKNSVTGEQLKEMYRAARVFPFRVKQEGEAWFIEY